MRKYKTEEERKAARKVSQATYKKTHPEKLKETRQNSKTKRRLTKWSSHILAAIKQRAIKKNLGFNIDVTDIIVPNYCPILGYELDIGNGLNNNSPSVDRINNNLGYIKGNIQVISRRANRLKSDASIDEVRKILSYMEAHE